jgi:hypothetical protein
MLPVVLAGCAKRSSPRSAELDEAETQAVVTLDADSNAAVTAADDQPVPPPTLVQRPGFPGPPYKPQRSELLEPTPAEVVAPPAPVAETIGSSASSDEGAAPAELLEQDPASPEYVSPTLALPRSRLIRRREEWTEAEAAADALGRIGAPATAELLAMLEDADPQMRRRGAEILARIGSDAEEAVPALIRVVEQDADPQVRKAAAFALGQIGPKAEAAVPALTRMLRE